MGPSGRSLISPILDLVDKMRTVPKALALLTAIVVVTVVFFNRPVVRDDHRNRKDNYSALQKQMLCAGLEQLFGNTTVADLGAGLGHYGRCFLRRSEGILNHPNKVEIENINKDYTNLMKNAGLSGTPQVIKSWNGWDGAANIDEFTNGRIASADLSSPATLGGPFDWVMSLEVGEHIPESGEKNFLDNLVKHACVGVVVSWAVPGQVGHSHVNCRSNDYVRREMTARGLESDKLAEVKLWKNVDQLTYFKNTLMVFRYPKKRC
ncbi:uncharacterized protein [Procambarus clarkii]|uniref:uncharacterized protein isoform X3 n=1 Tax=Procambarus clarkii TaxID=6728 RepID=UPI0037446033